MNLTYSRVLHRGLSSAQRLCREGVLLVVNLEHLVPSERPFAWLGVLRPSEACAGVLAKLGAAAAPATRERLQALQVWCWVPFGSSLRYNIDTTL